MTDIYNEFFEKYLLGKLGVKQKDYMTEDFIHDTPFHVISFVGSFHSFLIMAAGVESKIKKRDYAIDWEVRTDIISLEHYFDIVTKYASAPGVTEKQMKEFSDCISAFLPEYFTILQSLNLEVRRIEVKKGKRND